MAAFPSLAIAASSVPSRIHGTIPVRATNGDLKVRKTMSGDKWEFDLLLEMTAAQWTGTLEPHYQADKLNSFSFTYPTIGTKTVRYLGAPLPFEQPGGWFKVRVKLGEA